MGLLDILSNPQLIGMAMAGLSRDPNAPINAMKSMSMVEDINQKRVEQARIEQEEARKQQAQAETMQLLKSYGQSIGGEPEPDYSMLPPEVGKYLQARRAASAGPRNSLMQALSQSGSNVNPAVVSSIINHMTATKGGDDDIPKEYFKAQFNADKNPSTEWGFINQEVKAGRMTPEEAKQLLFEKIKPKPKEANMQPSYDMVGTKLMGAAYQTVEGRSQFADLYKTDPKVQKLVDDQVEREAKLKFQGFNPQVVYLQTDKGFVPMPARGAGVGSIPIGQPVEGLGKPVPSDQMTKMADLDTLQKQIGDTEKLFKPEYVGPVAGRYGSMKEKLVDIPEDQVQFYATVRDMKDSLLRARSGAQINEQEYKRLVSFLPDENLPSGNFVARTKRFKNLVNQVLSSKKSEISAGGYGSPQQPITQVPQTNNQPKTIRYNTQGQRVQ
jgi:hypothetical protein